MSCVFKSACVSCTDDLAVALVASLCEPCAHAEFVSVFLARGEGGKVVCDMQ